MECRPLGRIRLEAGVIGLGTEYLFVSPVETVTAVFDLAAAQGIDFVSQLYAAPPFLDKIATAPPDVEHPDELAAALRHLTASDAGKDLQGFMARFTRYVAGERQYCNHCLPCLAQIDIGALICLLDDARQGLTDTLRAVYRALPVRASACNGCGACLTRCPFKVYIPDRMVEAMDRFGE